MEIRKSKNIVARYDLARLTGLRFDAYAARRH
jgi:hypothetical protein